MASRIAESAKSQPTYHHNIHLFLPLRTLWQLQLVTIYIEDLLGFAFGER